VGKKDPSSVASTIATKIIKHRALYRGPRLHQSTQEHEWRFLFAPVDSPTLDLALVPV